MTLDRGFSGTSLRLEQFREMIGLEGIHENLFHGRSAFDHAKEIVETLQESRCDVAYLTLLQQQMESATKNAYSSQMLVDAGIVPIVAALFTAGAPECVLSPALGILVHVSSGNQVTDSEMRNPEFLGVVAKMLNCRVAQTQYNALLLIWNLMQDSEIGESVVRVMVDENLPGRVWSAGLISLEQAMEPDDGSDKPMVAAMEVVVEVMERAALQKAPSDLVVGVFRMIVDGLTKVDWNIRKWLMALLGQLVLDRNVMDMVADSSVPEALVGALTVCHDRSMISIYAVIRRICKYGGFHVVFRQPRLMNIMGHTLEVGEHDEKCEVLKLIGLFVRGGMGEEVRAAQLIPSIVRILKTGTYRNRWEAARVTGDYMLSVPVEWVCEMRRGAIDGVIEVIPTAENDKRMLNMLTLITELAYRGNEVSTRILNSETFWTVVRELVTHDNEQIAALVAKIASDFAKDS